MTQQGSSPVSESRRFQEWKQCQESAMAFDKMILDIRKYGFSFVTLLITAEGFLFGELAPNNLVVLGVYAALLVLILALFRVDRMHEVFLRGTVLRAMRLEELEDLGLTRSIAYWSEKCRTATWGDVMYILFAVAACTLSVAAIHVPPTGAISIPVVFHLTDLLATGAALLLLLLAVLFVYGYHRRTKPSTERELRIADDDPFKEHMELADKVWRPHGQRSRP